MTTATAIRVQGLEKSFKDVHVLRGVDLDTHVAFAAALRTRAARTGAEGEKSAHRQCESEGFTGCTSLLHLLPLIDWAPVDAERSRWFRLRRR